MNVNLQTVYIAPRLKRLLAYVIDILPISIIVYWFFISSTNYSVLFSEYLSMAESNAEAGLFNIEELNPAFIKYTNFINILVFVLLGVYGAYAETTNMRGTFGKHILKMAVGNQIGEPIDGGTAFKRNVLKIITLSVMPLLMIWVFLDKKNRAPYDVLAQTLLVSTKGYSDRGAGKEEETAKEIETE